MKILAIDTATEACSAALYVDGKITGEYQLAPREHTQMILPMVDNILKAAGITVADLDALSYARGPGAFTGVRIAAGVLQGLAYAHDIPVVPISTLAAIAAGVYYRHGHVNVLTAIDARMGEIYYAAYSVDNNQAVLVEDEVVGKVEALPDVADISWAGAGTGWSVYRDDLAQRYQVAEKNIFPDELPDAQVIARLAAQQYSQGNFMTAHQAQPVYLRDNVAKKKQNQ